MKKSICLLLIIITLLSTMLVITGCGNDKTAYKKETETYTLNRPDNSAKLTFEFAKDGGFTFKENQNNGTFENSENLGKIEIYFKYDYKNSSSITMKEDSFYAETYHDYQTINVNGHEGWSIQKTTQLITAVEMGLVLTEPDENNKVYAAIIHVSQSPLEKGKSFNAIEYYNSEDFQHLLNTLQVEITENAE